MNVTKRTFGTALINTVQGFLFCALFLSLALFQSNSQAHSVLLSQFSAVSLLFSLFLSSFLRTSHTSKHALCVSACLPLKIQTHTHTHTDAKFPQTTDQELWQSTDKNMTNLHVSHLCATMGGIQTFTGNNESVLQSAAAASVSLSLAQDRGKKKHWPEICKEQYKHYSNPLAKFI